MFPYVFWPLFLLTSGMQISVCLRIEAYVEALLEDGITVPTEAGTEAVE